ncbi:MAG: leucine--tRNA ligase [Verrucomicrobia bacterium]|nr:leucine--tRNA ligase [Verrucomicrobiota bacterium]MDA1067913.1 leucine--tRNA ligase [Verrucomicrobiota bacterium]
MSTPTTDYNFSQIEAHWQNFWAENKSFQAKDFSEKPKYYILSMYPYPSGDGLHIGHAINYTAPDILARYKKSQGFNTLQPMGWDAFGLPTEQYAIKTGTHPRIVTEKNVEIFRAQLQKVGFAIDWDREINTTDAGYVKWTQWIFLQLFKRGLAYVSDQPVWWCPALGTVLANEEVIDGKSERGDHPVEKRKLRQWVLKITAYAERLLEGHTDLNWPDSSIRLQKNWIGRSTGAEVEFSIEGHSEKLPIYTTRPDTLFGVTYMVLSPEHPLVDKLTTTEQVKAIADYRVDAAKKSDLERTDLAKDKTGVFTGSYALNPVNGAKVPIWVADYVLMSYGTGAIMAVPGHDERDFEFATSLNIPIQRVIQDEAAAAKNEPTQLPFSGKGTMINSGEYTGMTSDEGKAKIIANLEERNLGSASVQYKLRDWLFSRQRYWGEPFPVMWVSKENYEQATANEANPFREFLPEEPVTFEVEGEVHYALPTPTTHLPLELPDVESYEPIGTGESPLAGVTKWLERWLNTETGESIPRSSNKPEGDNWVKGTRETNTMPQWAGSCWYYLRYCDPKNTEAPIDPKIAEYWGVPDFYIGGAEHVNLHLLYARFWHQVLFDEGVTPCPEPFPALLHQGMILGEMEFTQFSDSNGTPVSFDAITEEMDLTKSTVPESDVEKAGDSWLLKSDRTIKVDARSHKMSKSRGNVVNPDSLIKSYGADATRLFLMFLGPIEDMKPWNTQGIEGVFRFLKRLWREVVAEDGGLNLKLSDGPETNKDLDKLLHESIKKVTQDIERLNFNTVVSQLMILLNLMVKTSGYSKETAKSFIQLLNPMAPHIAEELWGRLGGSGSICDTRWPSFDESKLILDEVVIVLQVNGKHRGELVVSTDATKEEIEELGLSQERVQNSIEGLTIRKVIYVPGKILNIVAN